jgi:hypothetical protein
MPEIEHVPDLMDHIVQDLICPLRWSSVTANSLDENGGTLSAPCPHHLCASIEPTVKHEPIQARVIARVICEQQSYRVRLDLRKGVVTIPDEPVQGYIEMIRAGLYLRVIDERLIDLAEV